MKKDNLKVFQATVKVLETKRVFIRAKDRKTAQKILSDGKTPKMVRNLNVEITYGDVSDGREKDFPATPKPLTPAQLKRLIKYHQANIISEQKALKNIAKQLTTETAKRKTK